MPTIPTEQRRTIHKPMCPHCHTGDFLRLRTVSIWNMEAQTWESVDTAEDWTDATCLSRACNGNTNIDELDWIEMEAPELEPTQQKPETQPEPTPPYDNARMGEKLRIIGQLLQALGRLQIWIVLAEQHKETYENEKNQAEKAVARNIEVLIGEGVIS